MFNGAIGFCFFLNDNITILDSLVSFHLLDKEFIKGEHCASRGHLDNTVADWVVVSFGREFSQILIKLNLLLRVHDLPLLILSLL